jgi:predicted Zn-dependent protease
MFERLDSANRISDNNSFPYLRSHPLTVDRISEARNRNLLAGGTPRPPTLLHALMQARSRVMMDDSAKGLQRLTGGTSSPVLADRVGALYAAALAASLMNEPARAEDQAAQALRLAAEGRPREPAAERVIVLLQAQVRLTRGDPAAALQALGQLETGGHERPPLLLRAQALLELQRRAGGDTAALRECTEALQTWLADQPQDAAAWELLAATSGALGLKLRAMRAGAEARAVVGDLGGAIDRLRAAQQATRSATGPDFIEASVIDTRLRQLMAQRRQLVLEARGERGSRAPEESPPQ